jgi:hypothetical protein
MPRTLCPGFQIAWADVATQRVLLHLVSASQEGGHDGDANAAADIAHKFKILVAFPIFSFGMPAMPSAMSGISRKLGATP